jgi:hypothetical protein
MGSDFVISSVLVGKSFGNFLICGSKVVCPNDIWISCGILIEVCHDVLPHICYVAVTAHNYSTDGIIVDQI